MSETADPTLIAKREGIAGTLLMKNDDDEPIALFSVPHSIRSRGAECICSGLNDTHRVIRARLPVPSAVAKRLATRLN